MEEYEYELFTLGNIEERIQEERTWMVTLGREYSDHGWWLLRLQGGFRKRTVEMLLRGMEMLTTEPEKAAQLLVTAKHNVLEIRRQLDARGVSPLGGNLGWPLRGPNPYVEVQPEDFACIEHYYRYLIAKIPEKHYD